MQLNSIYAAYSTPPTPSLRYRESVKGGLHCQTPDVSANRQPLYSFLEFAIKLKMCSGNNKNGSKWYEMKHASSL